MFKSFDCLCAGVIVADWVCHPIANMPPQGTLITTDHIELSIGGCAANVAADMAKLGLNIGVSGRVGDDLLGREIRHRLAASDVDVSALEVSTTTATSSTFVLNIAEEDRRFIHCVGANAEYDGEKLSDEAIQATKVLYVGGFCLLNSLTPDRVVRLFRSAREAGVHTMLNVVLPENTDLTGWLHRVLPLTDYFCTNDEEARCITHETDPCAQAEALTKMGARIAVVTRGSQGAVLMGSGSRLRAGVYPVEAIDATGTGDAFAAGFLYGVLRGEDLKQCLRLATAMGASCVRSMGATAGVFNSVQLETFIQGNSLLIEAI